MAVWNIEWEARRTMRQVGFDRVDTNKDGELSKAECEAAYGKDGRSEAASEAEREFGLVDSDKNGANLAPYRHLDLVGLQQQQPPQLVQQQPWQQPAYVTQELPSLQSIQMQ